MDNNEYNFRPEPHFPVVDIDGVLADGKQFDLAPAPDTGISAGQTIYFVGLIVLLCGVGIIYANAKPTQVQN